MCLAGIALVVLGVLCIMYPGNTLLSLAWAFGLMLIVTGCSTFGAAGCGTAVHLRFLGDV